MKNRHPLSRALFATLLTLALTPAVYGQNLPRRNVIIFVADGMRHGAVDITNTPTMADLRKNGVDFVNSHSLFPTVTTPNASAIATGHYIGDTGNFGNTLFLGYPSLASDAWGATHNVENNAAIPDICEHFSGNYLGEDSLLATARKAGLHTAIIGKLGPALVQDVTRNNPGITADNVGTVVIDDQTGAGQPRNGERGAIPLPVDISRRIANNDYFKTTYFSGQSPTADPRTAPRGANGNGGTKVANNAQQRYLIDTLTRAILPAFVDPQGDKKPFVVIYWSRDPDGTQHNELDVPDQLVPGVNGPTVKLAFQNADSNLKQLLDYLKTTPDPAAPDQKLSDTTDFFLTSDHGFGTISRGQMDMQGTMAQSFATQQRYSDTRAGLPPSGVLAIDLAHDLNLPLYDADKVDTAASTPALLQYKALKLEGTAGAGNWAEHPSGGAGLIGGAGTYDKDGYFASLVVVPQGGSSLIYAPAQRARNNVRPEPESVLMQKVVASLLTKPYISGVFVDTDRFGPIPGALSLADINLRGTARTPTPAAAVSFRTFSTDPSNPFMTGVVLADTGSRQGMGAHGSFGRHDTYNCMMAIGPDFKKQFADPDPVSNADISITLSHLLGIDMADKAKGTLHGRVLTEALANGPAPKGPKLLLQKTSAPGEKGTITMLLYQTYTDDAGHSYNYFDAAGFPGASVGLPAQYP